MTDRERDRECVRENVDSADNTAAVWGEIDGLDDTGGGKYQFCEDFRDSLIFGKLFRKSGKQVTTYTLLKPL